MLQNDCERQQKKNRIDVDVVKADDQLINGWALDGSQMSAKRVFVGHNLGGGGEISW